MPILLADLQDLLGAIVPVLFVIFWVISQVIGGINKARKGGARPPQEQPGKETPPTASNELANEIERFLGQTREASKTEKGTASHAESVVVADVLDSPAESQSALNQSVSNRKRPTREKRTPRQQQTQPIRGKEKKADAVFDPATFPPMRNQMDGVKKNEQQSSPGIIQLPTDDSAELQTLMANPATLRQAFLLSQIFSRPEDRW